jgi:hypothetical protein
MNTHYIDIIVQPVAAEQRAMSYVKSSFTGVTFSRYTYVVAALL